MENLVGWLHGGEPYFVTKMHPVQDAICTGLEL